MGKFNDLSGKRFGRLVVIKDTGKRNKSKKILWLCKCNCGNIVEVVAQSLTSGDTKSCGCLKAEKIRTHNMSDTRLYKTWADMLSRCRNKKSSNYEYYGGRGVKVCDDWVSFENFSKWATNNGYREDLLIDRIESSGDYEPGNCRWVTRDIQDNNKRNSIRIQINGQIFTLKQLSKAAGISYQAMLERFRSGQTGEKLLSRSHQGVKI